LVEDRWSFLAVQAYTKGMLSYSTTELNSPALLIKEALVFDMLDREESVNAEQMLYQQHLAHYTAFAPVVEEDDYDRMNQRVWQSFDEVRSIVRPFIEILEAKAEEVGVQLDPRSLWEQYYGTLDDPDRAHRIEEFAASVKEEMKGLNNAK